MGKGSRSAAMKKKCSDRQIGGKIALEIAFSIAKEKSLNLTAEQSQHLAACEECNQLLPLWFKKGAAAHETSNAYNIVNLAEQGDSRVLKKTMRSGTALFKPHEEDSYKGVLVQISLTGEISPAQETTIDHFNQLE